jgi:iron(III) transport system ATP-binding protein
VDPELAQFVGEAVLLPGIAEGGSVVCELGRLPLAGSVRDGPVEVLVRPEQIRLTAMPDSETPQIRAKVGDVTFYGHDASVALSLSVASPRSSLTARVPGHMSPHRGDEVYVSVEGAVTAYPSVKPGAG